MATDAARIIVLLIFGSLFVWWIIFRSLRARRALVAYEPRRRVPWNAGDVLVVVLSHSLIMGGLLAAAHTHFEHVLKDDHFSSLQLSLANLSSFLWMVAAIVYLVLRSGASLTDLGFDAKRWKSDARLGALAYLAALIPVYSLQAVLTAWYPSEHPVVKLLHEDHSLNTGLLVTVFAVFWAPLTEEFLFRVVLQGWLERVERRVWRLNRGRLANLSILRGALPIFISSLIFALMHLGHGPDPIPLLLLAIILGYVYRQTHRLWPSMLVHVLFNSTSMLGYWFGMD